MTAITASMVKELREKTGAGMMDCKVALTETSGDSEAAVDWLRKKGLSKAAKKSGRIAAEGLVAVAVRDNRAVLVEVNSETDFVARNEEFQALVRSIALVALETGDDLEKLKNAHYPGGDSIDAAVANAIATIGENMTLRRTDGLHVNQGVIGSYVHNAVADNLGKIGVIVALESIGNKDVLMPVARSIALHVAAANPTALEPSALEPALVARERNLLADKNVGKPALVLEKIIDSGMRTFYKEVCLVDQISIHAEHAGKSVAQVLKDSEKAAGAPIVLKGFWRYALGEGIDKPVGGDFAAEVAALQA